MVRAWMRRLSQRTSRWAPTKASSAYVPVVDPDDEDPAVLIDRQATSSGSRLVLGWNRHTVAALVDCASFLLEVHDLAVAT